MKGNSPEVGELTALYARDLDREDPKERWLVDGLWARQAVGLCAGNPKSLKTWVALDLAVSVASGTPALGRFKVEAPGTALAYFAEDQSDQLRSRIEGICRHRQLDIDELDLVVITEPGVRLDTPIDQERLRATLSRFKPRLLLLDPLVRLHSLNENDSQEISRLLGYFRELQRSFELAVILVHHTGKKSRSQPGLALRGSTDLHAFGDAYAYLARNSRDEAVTLRLEHRASRPPDPMTLQLVSSQRGSDLHLEIRDEAPEDEHAPSLQDRVLRLLSANRCPLKRKDLRAELGVNNQRLGEALSLLEANRKIRHTPRGWTSSMH